MTMLLDVLLEAGLISSFDREFAIAMGRLGGEQRPEALAAVALASHETNEGHTCLSFDSVLRGDGWRNIESEVSVPEIKSWQALVSSSPLVARLDTNRPPAHEPIAEVQDARPLVLDDQGRLYLRRYWMFQQRLAEDVRRRSATAIEDLDEAQLLDGLNRFFGPSAATGTSVSDEPGQLALDLDTVPLDRQRLAAAVAVAQKLAVITGGPGTGKTATAGKILALIVEQAFAQAERQQGDAEVPIRIAMVAPTGKAAATLSRSMKQVVERLPCDARVKAAIPTTAVTIHRCLGVRGGAIPTFRHDAENPLSVDTLLVDEASMVDLALMTLLLAAVPKDARVIFLGDEFQLASVEAGAVLGDICSAAPADGYSQEFATRLEAWVGDGVESLPDGHGASEIQDSIVRLTHSYRYDEQSGIGALSRAVNRGDAAAALEVLESADYPEVTRSDFDPRGASIAAFYAECIDGFTEYLSCNDPGQMLRRFSHFRVLTPQRVGPGGVEDLNRQIEAVLRREQLIHGTAERFVGRPLMVKVNDYAQSLWNGDLGVVVGGVVGGAEGGDPGIERVVFEADTPKLTDGLESDTTRTLAYARLPECETAFAMTIHKSQGSEFDRVAVVLTDVAAERATRELLYTAITRARSKVTLYGSKDAIAQAINRKIERSSGLGDALRSPTWKR